MPVAMSQRSLRAPMTTRRCGAMRPIMVPRAPVNVIRKLAAPGLVVPMAHPMGGTYGATMSRQQRSRADEGSDNEKLRKLEQQLANAIRQSEGLNRDLEVATSLLNEAAAKKSEMEAQMVESELRANELQAVIEALESGSHNGRASYSAEPSYSSHSSSSYSSSSYSSSYGSSGDADELRRELEVAQSMLHESSRMKSAYEDELASAEQRINELQEALEAAQYGSSYSAPTPSYSQSWSSSYSSSSSGDADELRRELETAKSLMNEAYAARRAMESEVSDAENRAAELQAEIDSLEAQLRVAGSGASSSYSAPSYSAPKSAARSYQGGSSDLQREVEVAQSLMQEAYRARAAMEERVAEAEARTAELEDMIEQLQGGGNVSYSRAPAPRASSFSYSSSSSSGDAEELRKDLEVAQMLLAEAAAKKSEMEAQMMETEVRAQELEMMLETLEAGGKVSYTPRPAGPSPSSYSSRGSGDVAQLQAALDAALADLEVANSMLAEAAAIKSDMEAQLMAAEVRANELESVIEQLEAQLAGSGISYIRPSSSSSYGGDEELRRDLEIAQQLLAEAAAKKSEMEAEVVAAESEAQELRALVENLQSGGSGRISYSSVSGGDEELRRDLEVANLLLAESAAKKSEMEAELAAAEARAIELQDMVEQLESRGGYVARSSSAGGDEDLRRDLEVAQQLLSETAAHKSAMEAELAEAEARANELQAMMESNGSYTPAASSYSSSSSGSEQELRRDLETLTALMSDSSAHRSAMEAELMASEQRIQELESLIEDMQYGRGGSMSSYSAGLSGTDEELRRDLEVANMMLAEAAAKKSEMEAQLVDSSSKAMELQAVVAELEAQVREALSVQQDRLTAHLDRSYSDRTVASSSWR